MADGMRAKSVDDQNGQYRANGPYGSVCNEQVPASKEKVCSELSRNREKAAEMTASPETVVTDCASAQPAGCIS